MAVTPSNSIPLGTKAPDFNLKDVVSGEFISLTTTPVTDATVVMFICNHCPFVKHILSKLVHLAAQYQAKGVRFIAISANDPEKYPEDAPLNMQQLAQEKHFSFPYLFDETQNVAKSYSAACTPEFYVLNKQHEIIYHGRFDDANPGNQNPVTGRDLQAALEAILAKKPLPSPQIPSIGCNIKWKQ